MEYGSDANARSAYITSAESPYSDTFTGSDGGAINSDIWTLSGSPDIQSNTAELTYPESITSKNTFIGDFNIQVDFTLQSPPAANSFGANLQITIDGTHALYLRVARYGGAKYWQTCHVNGGAWAYVGYSRTNDYGKLKIIRSGATFTVYAADGAGSFAQKGSTFTVGTVGNTVSVSLAIVRWDTNPTLTCRFANFTINSGYVGTNIILCDYSEPTIITDGLYSLKGIAAATTSLNKTLTHTISTPINLTSHAYIIGKIRASRTGSNIKIGFHDSGGTTTEVTPNIDTADTWQLITLDISAVSYANKDAIDQIIITVVNADADNTFYLDNFFAATAADYALGIQASKVVAYAVLTPCENALSVSKVVAYAVLGPYVEPESGSGPMMWIF